MKTFATFFVITLILLTSPVFALQSDGEGTCTGHWDGHWFWQKSDPTITEYYEWKALDTLEPYRGPSDREDPANIFGRVTTSQSTTGFGNVGVTADGNVSGPGDFALALGFEWNADSVGWNMFGTTTSKSTTGSKSTLTEGSYTLSGTGEVMGVAGGGSIGLLGLSLRGAGEIRFNNSPTFVAPSPLVVTTEQDIPPAYECSHENCEVALPDKHFHRHTCKEKVYFALGSVVKVDCNRKYYKCQRSTCPNEDKHIIPHACGHEDEKEDAWKHARQASCSTSITQNGSTVYCQSKNYFLCLHDNHEWPPVSNPPSGGGSNSPSDNTPNCPDCTSHCSSPCVCTNSGTCNGSIGSPPDPPAPSEPDPPEPPEPSLDPCGDCGDPYDPDSPSDANRHRVLTCRLCGKTWHRCQGSKPICDKPYRKRNGLSCVPPR